MRRCALLLVVAACTEYAHVSTLNAPGNVDLSTPMPRENGDPRRIEEAADPGSKTLMVALAPYLAGGVGRYEPGRNGSGEAGLEIRIEHVTRPDRELMQMSNWSLTTGFAFAQWGDGTRTIAPGAFFAELGYRFRAKVWPIEFGAGPAMYVDDTTFGGQLTARCAIFMMRTRYMGDSGIEFLVGGELPIPFFFSQSR